MDNYILDTFALMAYIQDEPSSDTIETLLAQAVDERVTWASV